MRPLIANAFFAIAVLMIIGVAALAPARAETVFENVTILTMDERGVLVAQTVIVEGDRIAAMGPAGEVATPEGATMIDGTGKFLMPGFAEMHGHVPPLSAGDDAVNDTLFLYLSNGVTTVRGMLGSEGQLQLREDAQSGARLSPTLYLAGPSFNGGSVSSPEQATAMVDAQVEQGWDLLKIHPGLTRAEYDAMAARASAAGIDFAGHVPEEVGLERALAAGQRSLDHLDGYIAYLGAADAPADAAALADIAKKTKAAGVGVVPTSALWASLMGVNTLDDLIQYPELKYVSPATLANWRGRARRSVNEGAVVHVENRRRLLKALQDAGVEVLFGTDAPQLFSVPGFSIHREIEEMAAAGLAPIEILASGTLAVGAYFADKDAFGTVAVGMRADLILLNANPLDDLSAMQHPAGVMVRGRWLSREDLDRGLAKIADRYSGE